MRGTARAAARHGGAASVALLGLLLVAALACGGGGGGGGGPTVPPPPTSMLVFTPDAVAGTNAVFLDIPGSSVTTFALQIRANEVDDLYGVTFDLVYPSNLMSWDGNAPDEGNFLGRNGRFDTDLTVVEDSPGRLIVSYTRLGTVGGRSGSGRLFSLGFTSTVSGSGAFELVNPFFLNSAGTQDEGADFLAGSISIQL